MRVGSWMLALAVALGGCESGTRRLQSEWEVTVEQRAGLPLSVVDYLPLDGSSGVGPNITPYLFLNRPVRGDEGLSATELELVDISEGDIDRILGELEWDDAGVRFEADGVVRDEVYGMSVMMPDAAGASIEDASFSTYTPSQPTYNMASGLQVDAFGGRSDQAQLLTDVFVPGVYPQWLMQFTSPLVGLGELSIFTSLVFGPSRPGDDGESYLLHRSFGFSSGFRQVQIDADMRIEHEQKGVFLPLWSGDDVIILYLAEVHLSAQLSLGGDGVPRVDSLRIAGVLGTRWLLRLAEEGGTWRSVVNQARLDRDSNGNETPDAATFEISAQPELLADELLDL